MNASIPDTVLIRRLYLTHAREEQIALRTQVQDSAGWPDEALRIYFNNPFFRLLEKEATAGLDNSATSALLGLVRARETAVNLPSPKYVVFCMPKSGSSFVQSALQHALQLPFVSLTSFGAPSVSSHFGMNSREQELDELAIVKSGLVAPAGYVAQHHTRCSAYLTTQMRHFGISPLLTVRNVLDCLVSFDEMLLSWRSVDLPHPWITDAPFALPLNYPELEPAARYEVLGRSFGVWAITFYLSWKRCMKAGTIDPLVIRYEEDVLQPDRLVERVCGRFDLAEGERDRLAAYVRNPDRERSRLNVGVEGRGKRLIPETMKAFLADYAGAFAGELDAEDVAYLVE